MLAKTATDGRTRPLHGVLRRWDDVGVGPRPGHRGHQGRAGPRGRMEVVAHVLVVADDVDFVRGLTMTACSVFRLDQGYSRDVWHEALADSGEPPEVVYEALRVTSAVMFVWVDAILQPLAAINSTTSCGRTIAVVAWVEVNAGEEAVEDLEKLVTAAIGASRARRHARSGCAPRRGRCSPPRTGGRGRPGHRARIAARDRRAHRRAPSSSPRARCSRGRWRRRPAPALPSWFAGGSGPDRSGDSNRGGERVQRVGRKPLHVGGAVAVARQQMLGGDLAVGLAHATQACPSGSP